MLYQFGSYVSPRDLTEKEVDAFHLRVQVSMDPKDTKILTPKWEGTDTVWATATHSLTPTYRVYNTGTNSLTILKYYPERDTWEQIPCKEGPPNIDNLYGFIWSMISSI